MKYKEKFLLGVVAAITLAATLSTAHTFYNLKSYTQFTATELGYQAGSYEACEWGESSFLIFSNNVGNLIYYTHVFPLVISLFIGIFVLANNYRDRKNVVFSLLTLLFALWAYFDLVLWASPSQADVMFFWSAIVPVEMFLYLLSAYLMYLFTRGVDAPFYGKLAGFIIALPTIVLMPTALNVVGLSPDCDEGAFEGPVIHYMYIMEIGIILFICYLTLTTKKFFKNSLERKKAHTIGGATIIFLIFFTMGNLTLMFELGPNYEQYKLFGMPIFAALVTYALVKFRAFGVKVLLTQVLVAIIWVLLFSVTLLESMERARAIILLTLVVFSVVALQLVRSVKREVEQREELEKLAYTLEHANERLKELDKLKSEFVSIASHQLRSPLTAIRGYASMLEEGSFGTLSEKARNAVHKISESSRLMALSVEDYLNVSRIQAGRMRYEMSDSNICDLVESAVDGLRAQAQRKGILLTLKKQNNHTCLVRADIGKGNQIIHNLIDNALKYTNEGFVDVTIKNTGDTVEVAVSDTGAGLSKSDLATIFEKFERAKDANNINPSGTGLGLYLAQKMARDMGGDVIASSPGKNLGSTFTLILPQAK